MIKQNYCSFEDIDNNAIIKNMCLICIKKKESNFIFLINCATLKV